MYPGDGVSDLSHVEGLRTGCIPLERVMKVTRISLPAVLPR